MAFNLRALLFSDLVDLAKFYDAELESLGSRLAESTDPITCHMLVGELQLACAARGVLFAELNRRHPRASMRDLLYPD